MLWYVVLRVRRMACLPSRVFLSSTVFGTSNCGCKSISNFQREFFLSSERGIAANVACDSSENHDLIIKERKGLSVSLLRKFSSRPIDSYYHTFIFTQTTFLRVYP